MLCTHQPFRDCFDAPLHANLLCLTKHQSIYLNNYVQFLRQCFKERNIRGKLFAKIPGS